MNNNKILIVEDDKEINKLLCDILGQKGYTVASAFTGIDGVTKVKASAFDMIILDIMLPFKSGDELLRELRAFSDIPVIIISAKALTQIKIDLLRLGADDYITKPFDIDEVIARVESCFRRYKPFGTLDVKRVMSYKDITLERDEKVVQVNNKVVNLTSKEYKILELFLTHPNKVYSKPNLFESVWGEEYFSDDNTLNVHMSNLRNKLKSANCHEEYIETIWGMGYRLFKVESE